MTDEEAMSRAIAACRDGIRAGQSPFGAVVVKEGLVIAEAHNTVRSDNDPTAHGEINVIRATARVLRSYDLTDCTLFTTCEPCPMCLAAMHWAKIDRVCFGATIAHAEAAGFREMPISAERMAAMGASRLRVVSGLLTEDCRALFDEWKRNGQVIFY